MSIPEIKYIIRFPRPIKDYPLYEIFADGRIRNIKRNSYLKAGPNKEKYYLVKLYKNGKGHMKKRSRLLAQAFIDNPEKKPIVDHINQKKYDDRLENLRWATSSQNNINMSVRNNTKTGYKYIHYEKNAKRKYVVRINLHNIYERFATLEEAIIFRDSLKEELGLIF